MADKGPEDAEKEGEKMKKLGKKTLFAIICILTIEACERLSFYSITANLTLFTTSVLKFTDPQAVKLHQVFGGSALLLPIAGGFIADCYVGRYNTILASSCIYIVGLVLIPASALDYRGIFSQADGFQFDLNLESRRIFFICGLTAIALGMGGIKATVGPFGAQQVRKYGDGAVRSFFNWFYWFIQIGSTLAFTGVAYVQQNISFAWGYFIPLITMVFVIIVFISTRRVYRITPPGENAFRLMFGVLMEASRRRHPRRKFLDSARKRFGGSYDEDTVTGVMSTFRMTLLFLPFTGFTTAYSMSMGISSLQSLRLDVSVGGFRIPVAALGIFNAIGILVLIPLVDRVVYPYMEKIGKPITHLRRIGIGLLIAVAGLVISGGVEIARKQELASSGGLIQTLGGRNFNSSHISVFVQTPAIILGGISEVFTYVPALEFCFTQVPVVMQAMMQGSFLAMFGIGSYIAAAITSAMSDTNTKEPWLTKNINTSRGEHVFFVLAGIVLFSFFLHIAVSVAFRSGPQDGEKKQRDSVTDGRSGPQDGEKKQRDSVTDGRSGPQDGEKKQSDSVTDGRSGPQDGEKKQSDSVTDGRSGPQDGEKKQSDSVTESRPGPQDGEKDQSDSVTDGRSGPQDGEKKQNDSVTDGRSEPQDGEKKQNDSVTDGRLNTSQLDQKLRDGD